MAEGTISTLALDCLAEGVLLVDGQGHIVYANAMAGRLLGRLPNALRGTAFSVPAKTDAPVEITLPSVKSDPATVQMQVVPLDRHGNRLSLVSLHDISPVKAMQQELEAERRALQDSNQNLNEFAYAISHDLQQPLNVVVGFLQLLELRAGARLTDEEREFIGFAVEGTRRMSAMIRGLLAYSRVHTQGQVFRPVCVADALGVALANLRAAIEEAGAVVTQDPMPMVQGDFGQIVSLLQNLVDNAIKYRDAGRVPTVHVGVWGREGARVVISVADNGIGIDRKHHDRIFGVFNRLHTEQEYPGTGIGLSLCKRIVDRHGGRIWLDSEVGRGTTMYVALPVPAKESGSVDGLAEGAMDVAMASLVDDPSGPRPAEDASTEKPISDP